MGAIYNFVRYVDTNSVPALRAVEKIIVIGTAVNLVVLFAKCILPFVALITHVHRRSDLLSYLEGRTVKECRYLLNPFSGRRAVIADRQEGGARDFDRAVILNQPGCWNLAVFADLIPTLQKDPKFITEMICRHPSKVWPEHIKTYLKNDQKFLALIKENLSILKHLDPSMVDMGNELYQFFEGIDLYQEKNESFKTNHEAWIHLIRLFPKQDTFEYHLPDPLKTNKEFLTEMCRELNKTKEGKNEILLIVEKRIVEGRSDVYEAVDDLKKDPTIILKLLCTNTSFWDQVDPIFKTKEKVAEFLLETNSWNYDKQKEFVQRFIKKSPDICFQALEHLEKTNKIPKITKEECEDWFLDLDIKTAAGNLSALYYHLRYNPIAIDQFMGIEEKIYPYLDESLKKKSEEILSDDPVREMHQKLIKRNPKILECLDPSWKEKFFISLFFIDLDEIIDFNCFAKQIVDFDVNVFIQALNSNGFHLLQNIEPLRKHLNDSVIQKILIAAASKDQKEQLAVCAFMLKHLKPGLFIKNLDLLIKNKTITALDENKFDEWKKNNALFYKGIFFRKDYANCWKSRWKSQDTEKYDLEKLRGAESHKDNLAAIHYGFTVDIDWVQRIDWMQRIGINLSCFKFSIAATYPYFCAEIKNDKKITQDLIFDKWDIWHAVDPSLKTEEFVFDLLQKWGSREIDTQYLEFMNHLLKNEPTLGFKGACLHIDAIKIVFFDENSPKPLSVVSFIRKNPEKMLELINKDPLCLQYADPKLLEDDNFILSIPLEKRIPGVFQANHGPLCQNPLELPKLLRRCQKVGVKVVGINYEKVEKIPKPIMLKILAHTVSLINPDKLWEEKK